MFKKNLNRPFIALLATVILSCGGSVTFAGKIKSAKIKLVTPKGNGDSDDKHSQNSVHIDCHMKSVKIAKGENVGEGTKFNDPSTHSYSLKVEKDSEVTLEDLKKNGLSVRFQWQSDDDDDWIFTFTVTLDIEGQGKVDLIYKDKIKLDDDNITDITVKAFPPED
jgi:uncharacterized glyoxalase superfamily protein PhnB